MSEKVKIKIARNVVHLPAIALRGLVVFPNNVVHFEVGRTKSIAAIEAAMHANSSVFLVAQREMDEEEPALHDLYAYGVIAEIKQVLRVSDDLVKVLVEGKTRARLLALDVGEKYLQATVRPVAVRGIPADKRNQVEALVRSLKDCFEEYLSYSPQISKDVVYNIVSSDSPLYLSEYMPANLLFKYEDKQVILNESTLLGRLEKLLTLLRQECQIMDIERDLDDKVNARMDKGQREYYLREQIKVLQNEIGEGGEDEELDEYREKISKAHLSEEVERKLLKDVDKHIPYEQAKQTVYDALAPLGDDYRTILKNGFDHRWIDVYQNEGKRSGAYSAGTVVHPYVLLNYTGTLDSQFTLAHEMGHALHSYLSNKHQNPIDADYVIFVAEVASTCNEALLMEYLLGKTTDKKERAYLINHFLDQFKGTLYRQTMFAEFELNIGKMAAEGQTLTADVLCAEYKRLNELYYGPDMVVDDNIAMEWARIPHFYYNYYVFQYATGYSAAIALSRRILREGAPAVKDYLGFLSGGCSKSPIDLLKGAGVDMTSPEPVNQALALFGELLDEMEELTRE